MVPSDDNAAAGYELAYTEARRALDDQERVVSELRTRAGVLIAAAAITTSFFGNEALTRASIGYASWLAIGCFCLLGFTVMAILWPRRDWMFSVNARAFIATYLEPYGPEPYGPDAEPMALPMIHRDLALHMEDSFDSNRRQLRVLMGSFRAGAVLLLAEVVAWVVAIA